MESLRSSGKNTVDMRSVHSVLNMIPPLSEHTQLRDDSKAFHLFANLPTEIRMRIWKAALAPRIVRWVRSANGHRFIAPPRSLPLLAVSQESRIAAFLYGMYRVLTAYSNVYFSPVIDFLWIDPGWTDPYILRRIPEEDPLDSMREQFGELRNVMVHPNWSGERKEPLLSFATLPSVRIILVAADERSIGVQSEVMLETMQDIKYYYYGFQKGMPNKQIPYIAVGCLGWTGIERGSLWRGETDNRKLLAVFENYAEMKAHLAYLREEEWKFTQQRFDQPKIVHKLRWARKKEDSERTPTMDIQKAPSTS
jgi:hypothetical protein